MSRSIRVLCVAGLWPFVCQAGLSLDEAIERDRALRFLEGTRASPAPLGIEGAARDGVVFAGGGPGDHVPPLLGPMVRGEGGGLRVRATRELAGGGVRMRFGASVRAGDDHVADLDGSEASASAGSGRVYASVERRHWGPSWTGSLILDAGSRPVPAIGWRKDDAQPFSPRWLSWLGPWRADLFAGGLSQRTGPKHSHLIGGRLEIMPIDGLELAASRTMQWGGSGRPESLGSLYRALIGDDNADSEGERADEAGNQLAGFDFRYTLRLAGGRTVAVYGQAIGEDEAGGLPSRYLGSYGADVAFTAGGVGWRAFVEHADTSVGGAIGKPKLGPAYRHHIYTDGYTQLGDPLGHPLGGDARLTSIGVFADAGRWTAALALHRGSAYTSSQLYGRSGRLSGANAELAWQVTAASRVGLAMSRWHDPQATRTRAQVWWEQALP